MLSKFRKMTKVVIWIVVVAFVGTIIFAWGMDITRSKTQQNIIGVIDGEDIDFQYYRVYLDRLRQQEQGNSDAEMDIATLNRIRREAWDNLVADFLMTREMDKRNISVTDAELYQFLKYSPPQEFQQDPSFMNSEGQFDYQLYLAALANPQASQLWIQVERYYRPELRRMKLQNQIASTVRVGENDIREYYLNNNEKAKADIISVGISKYVNPGPEMTEEEIQNYYQTHLDEYEVEERASLDFVSFSKEPTEGDWDLIKFDAEQIKAQLDDGEDFAELAIAYSEGPTGPNGGDLGWFGPGKMVQEFNDAAFAMEVGEISEPVRTQFGWHIIKVDEKRKNDNGEDEIKASHILLKVKASSETLDRAFENAQGFLEIAESNGFETATGQFELEIQNTGLMTLNRPLAQFGYDRRYNNFAFKNEIGTISPIFENDASVIVTRVAEKRNAGVASFEEVKSEVQGDLKNHLALQICESEINKVYQAIQDGAEFNKATQDAGLEIISTDLISRDGFIKNIGRELIVIGTMFRLQNPGDLSKPVKYDRGCAIVKLLERQSAELDKYGVVRDSLEQNLLQTRMNETLNSWYIDMLSSAKIENYIDEFFTTR
ncbi:MAG: peptidylprolyl isomerase [candidate division Zixibacteria bacterium]